MVPARTLSGWQDDSDTEDIVSDLDLEFLGAFGDVSSLPQAIAAVLVHDDAHEAFAGLGQSEDPALHQFAERAAYGRVLAAEASPIGAESLANLATAKGVTGAAGISVAAVAFGATPLLLIAAPVGIILVGAALGVSDALQQGLRKKLLQRMGVDEESEAHSGVSA
jgi:hypothetical protein